MVAGDDLAGLGEFPQFGETRTQHGVVNAGEFALDCAEIPVALAHFFANKPQLFGRGLKRNKQADIVNHPREEGFIRDGEAHRTGDFAGGDNAMRPEILGGEAFAQLHAAEKLAQAGGDGDVLHRIQAQQNDGPLDGRDLARQAVKRAVDDLEDARDQRRIVRDDLVQLRAGGAKLVGVLGNHAFQGRV